MAAEKAAAPVGECVRQLKAARLRHCIYVYNHLDISDVSFLKCGVT